MQFYRFILNLFPPDTLFTHALPANMRRAWADWKLKEMVGCTAVSNHNFEGSEQS